VDVGHQHIKRNILARSGLTWVGCHLYVQLFIIGRNRYVHHSLPEVVALSEYGDAHIHVGRVGFCERE
jgi:hypothetical protein